MITSRRLIVALTFIALFAMAVRVSVDTDTWWHLRAGAWMVEHREVLDFDPFSHTRAGERWVNHSWLSEIGMVLLYSAFGYAGLNLATALAVVGAFAFVHAASEGGPLARAFAVVLAATASAVYWSARPQMMTFLLAGAFVYILDLYARRRVNRLWVLVPLMALWVNLHAGFAVGFILIGLTLAGELVEALIVRLSEPESSVLKDSYTAPTLQSLKPILRRLAPLVAASVACAIAALANPFGVEALLVPFRTVSIGVLKDYIQEWQSPNFHSRETQPFLWLLFSTLAAAGFSGRRMRATDLLLVAGLGYLAFLAGRNISLFALVAAPALTRHASAIAEGIQSRYPSLMTAGADALSSRLRTLINGTLLALVAVAAALKISVPLRGDTNDAYTATILPVGAAAALREDPPAGRMFNSYNWGGYLVWALYPHIPVYVDGRTDLYDDALLREYLSVAFAREGWQAVLDEHDIGFVVFEADSSLAEALAEEPGWALHYRDEIAVVYARAWTQP